ncbi:MAG: DUF975 family protein [Lachnospiraceae bacterium]|nr:DUF975 family protein [Lachnospiraceae bacterium]
MWTRKELKQRAKEALQRNYWRIVLVAALAAVLGGGMSASGSSVSSGVNGVVATNTTTDDAKYTYMEDMVSDDDESAWIEDNMADEGISDTIVLPIESAREELGDTTVTVYMVTFAVIAIIIVLFICAVTFAVALLLYNPFRVGVQRFMIKSIDDRAEVKEVLYAFDHSYKNVVRTMFHEDIRVFLWSLLFVIPGIYKSYQYRMVSYILAEHPDMDYRQVLQMSKDMMNGEKWHAFVLDLSFILWHMLGFITCGIVELFYVNPYVWLTNAALYRKLCEQYDKTRQAALPDNNYAKM